MNLHHAHTKPDWDYVPIAQRNTWQHAAARTRGIVTPGNMLSVIGLGLVLAGLWLVSRGDTLHGLVTLTAGRLFDVCDGYVAAKTQTKSPLGREIDATIDKIAALAALGVLAIAHIVPFWVTIAIAMPNIANIILALIARQHFIHLQPSRLGKNAAAGFWMAIVLFVAYHLLRLSGDHLLLQTVTLEAAYAITFGALALGVQATIGYIHKVFRRPAGKYAALELFDRYIVIQNPESADAHKTDERIRELRRLCPQHEITVLKTRAGGVETNRQLLREHSDKLGKRTLLCIAAGDGTTNVILDALLHDPELPESARQTPLLPLWCGNANDLAYILNGRPTWTPVHKVLRRGQVIAIKPLECTFRYNSGQTRTFTAASYASFGATAFATKEMESTFRSKSPIRRFGVSRFGQEVIAAAWALMRAPTFTVSEEGKTRVIFERTHLNGSRFAKVIGLPLRITDERFHRATIEHKRFTTFALHILGIVGDKDLAKKTITHDIFTVHDDVWAQFDGEAVRVPAETKVEVSVAAQPFYALSTRLGR